MTLMTSVDPATGLVVDTYQSMAPEVVAETVARTQEAWLAWRLTGLDERAARLRELAMVVRRQRDELARLMAREMGKAMTEGRGELEKCAAVCEYYAEHGAGMLAPEAAPSDAARSYVAFRPLGVVLAVMPWNFPFWQVFRCAAPALMAGNGLLLKHASNVPGCALALEKLFAEAGFPADLFRTLLIGSRQVEPVIRHPAVRAVALTGSEPAGRQVAALAGSVLKKTVLELGGSDPFIVTDGADLHLAATVGARARCINAGQSCIAAKRFIVYDAVYEAFLDRFLAAMQALRVGPPLEEETEIGPLARADLRDELQQQVAASVAAGARLLLGGVPPEGPGCYYPPTILADVRPGMPAYDQELFGPVAAVIRVADSEQALRVANDSPYGLGAAVWDRDAARGEALAARIEAGAVFVNGQVKSDPRLPFGGIKDSGYGRELSSYGLREFVNIQTVWVR